MQTKRSEEMLCGLTQTDQSTIIYTLYSIVLKRISSLTHQLFFLEKATTGGRAIDTHESINLF